jgi:hypothetical protein
MYIHVCIMYAFFYIIFCSLRENTRPDHSSYLITIIAMVVYRLTYIIVEFVITGLVFNKIDTVHNTMRRWREETLAKYIVLLYLVNCFVLFFVFYYFENEMQYFICSRLRKIYYTPGSSSQRLKHQAFSFV